MKRNNVAKRFGIASLCLATAFSAIGSTAWVNSVALAEGTDEPTNTVQATDLVHVTDTATVAITEEAARVTGNKLEKDKTSFTGLRISSNEPYKATFKTVFDGNMEIKFRFPETYTDALYGDFTFRFTDATDDSNYFDITYYVVKEDAERPLFSTAPYVQWGDEIRMSTHKTSYEWTNVKVSNKDNYQFAPAFLTKASVADRSDRMGILSLEWVGDILTVSSNTTGNGETSYTASNMIPIAAFDGTYDTSKPNNGLIGKQTTDPGDRNIILEDRAGGLPTMNFENGYTVTVSSSFEDARTTDRATDVFFASIISDETYDFSNAEITKNDQMQAFEDGFEFLPEAAATDAGKVFLGYKSAAGKLYGVDSLVKKGGTYQPLVISYDTINGASVRVDSEAGQSGIRFQTLFNPTEYEAVKDYIKSFGTLIAYTDTLTKGDFTIENYAGDATFAKVQNTKGTFEYTDKEDNVYVAYSMALVNIQDYTRAYSARGYLVVEYADGTTATVYTDYNATDNSRSIAEVANLLKTQDVEKYEAMNDAQKAIINAYVAALDAPEA